MLRGDNWHKYFFLFFQKENIFKKITDFKNKSTVDIILQATPLFTIGKKNGIE